MSHPLACRALILRFRTAATGLLAGLPLLVMAQVNDFPTVDRVLYVQECMRAHPGPHYEMINKCACALDRLATDVRFDDYVGMATAANATTIGGERGSYIRENEPLQALIKRYRELQTRVKKACFVIP